MKTSPINPQRLRRIPPHFSWIDHRLVRHGYLQRCDHLALSLYLFYLTVADAQGMSYYADPRLMTALSITQQSLNAARHCLIEQRLIAYRPPFVQVLSLDESRTDRPRAKQKINPRHPIKTATSLADREKSNALIQQLRAQLRRPQ